MLSLKFIDYFTLSESGSTNASLLQIDSLGCMFFYYSFFNFASPMVNKWNDVNCVLNEKKYKMLRNITFCGLVYFIR